MSAAGCEAGPGPLRAALLPCTGNHISAAAGRDVHTSATSPPVVGGQPLVPPDGQLILMLSPAGVRVNWTSSASPAMTARPRPSSG